MAISDIIYPEEEAITKLLEAFTDSIKEGPLGIEAGTGGITLIVIPSEDVTKTRDIPQKPTS